MKPRWHRRYHRRLPLLRLLRPRRPTLLHLPRPLPLLRRPPPPQLQLPQPQPAASERLVWFIVVVELERGARSRLTTKKCRVLNPLWRFVRLCTHLVMCDATPRRVFSPIVFDLFFLSFTEQEKSLRAIAYKRIAEARTQDKPPGVPTVNFSPSTQRKVIAVLVAIVAVLLVITLTMGVPRIPDLNIVGFNLQGFQPLNPTPVVNGTVPVLTGTEHDLEIAMFIAYAHGQDKTYECTLAYSTPKSETINNHSAHQKRQRGVAERHGDGQALQREFVCDRDQSSRRIGRAHRQLDVPG